MATVLSLLYINVPMSQVSFHLCVLRSSDHQHSEMGKGLLVFVLLLALFASEGSWVKVAEAKMCQTTSHALSCVNDWTCNSSCEKQGFASGKCDGVRRRCTCFKPCA